ncbi:MAG: tetratricopeptide repeat protein [Nitrospirae bacterium]|nr:tetratricopeptide repeat protein [Candidatus Manganitrophaceae bacterium]
MNRVLFSILLVFLTLSGCYGGSGGSGGAGGQIPAIASPAGMTQKDAAAKNDEGVDHLLQGHYDVSAPLFKEAVGMKPDFAEAHFNLGLALDGKGDHAGATEEFKKAKEFGGSNPKIAENAILKKHLGS